MKEWISVTELNRYVSDLVAQNAALRNLAVQGEISGFKRYASGHCYFSLKDPEAVISCVMFRGQAQTLTFQPSDGMRVVITCYASFYEKDGKFQLYVQNMLPVGRGALYEQYLLRKAKYEQKGYFDPVLKKEIPFLPKAVSVVSSGDGAAVHDIRNVIGRRFPGMPIHLYSVHVQGTGAAEEIAAAIALADRERKGDVLIVARGGGSMEDLWAFNEVPVVEAVHSCTMPVISGVGHETDFTLCDFAADLRAPTPSAAAEMAVPEFAELKDRVDAGEERLKAALYHRIDRDRTALQHLQKTMIAARDLRLQSERRKTELFGYRLDRVTESFIAEQRARLEQIRIVLEQTAPQNVLKRGYTMVTDSFGQTVPRGSGLKKGEQINIVFYDGSRKAEILHMEDADGTET